ncbi:MULTISPECIES: HNH endonuclease signature motif containing protein [unclassified Novosphingobium]|uniref:HNH endonuclease signature motif containing protein n=1 Tax=unclassified Novosphingobium TaxID=2644732 RepID=UPI001359B8BE|nr:MULTISPECIES: HNH endonuclease signature motif containing protein [unclassified Novosphingobium]
MAEPSWRSDKRKTAERGYGGKWQKARETFIAANPLCVRCDDKGLTTVATVVNHRVPHKGDLKLFWDRKNWEAVCKPCHDGEIQREERTGIVRGTGRDGRPLDPSHPWNRSS